MASRQWIKGYSHPDHPEDEGDMTIDGAITKLRDEVTGLLMQRFGGRQRALSMVLTKLDEAKLWAWQYGEDTGAMVVVDRGPILQLVHENYGLPHSDTAAVTHPTTDTTVTTDQREG